MSTTAIPTTTERRYRRLLLLLPFWYRERYADEMVEVYLAGAPGDRAWPSAAETGATVRLAVTTRVRRVGPPSRATLVLLAVVGSAALAADALRAIVLGLAFLLSREESWTMGAGGRLVVVERSLGLGAVVDTRDLVWVVVLVALLAGLRRLGTVVAALVAALDVGAAFSPFLSPDAAIFELALARTDARAAVLPVLIVAALVLAGAARGVEPGRRSRILAAGGTVVALTVGYAGVRYALVDAADESFWPVATTAVAVAAVVVLLASRRIDPAWPATVLVLAVVVVFAGPLPAGSRFVGGGVERTVTDGPLDPVLLPGLAVGAVAVVLAASAWVIAVDRRRPDAPTPSGRRPELVVD